MNELRTIQLKELNQVRFGEICHVASLSDVYFIFAYTQNAV